MSFVFLPALRTAAAASREVVSSAMSASVPVATVTAIAIPCYVLAARLWMPLPFLNDNLAARLPVLSVIQDAWTQGVIPL